MQNLTWEQVMIERLNVIIITIACACIAFVGGTATGEWRLFVGIALVLFIGGMASNEMRFDRGSDGSSGLIAGPMLFAIITGLAYAFWQDEHPVRAQQVYAITGSFVAIIAIMDVIGHLDRSFYRRTSQSRMDRYVHNA